MSSKHAGKNLKRDFKIGLRNGFEIFKFRSIFIICTLIDEKYYLNMLADIFFLKTDFKSGLWISKMISVKFLPTIFEIINGVWNPIQNVNNFWGKCFFLIKTMLYFVLFVHKCNEKCPPNMLEENWKGISKVVWEMGEVWVRDIKISLYFYYLCIN